MPGLFYSGVLLRIEIGNIRDLLRSGEPAELNFAKTQRQSFTRNRIVDDNVATASERDRRPQDECAFRRKPKNASCSSRPDGKELMARRAVLVTIPEDATIADVVENLDHPIEYVRRVLEKLERCRRAHGDAQVRIGVAGRAECPNYLIEYISEDLKTGQKSIHPDAAYSGSTHRELAPRHIDETKNWSCEEMNITAVSALVGRLRNRAS